jgi:hypothetical protein
MVCAVPDKAVLHPESCPCSERLGTLARHGIGVRRLCQPSVLCTSVNTSQHKLAKANSWNRSTAFVTVLHVDDRHVRPQWAKLPAVQWRAQVRRVVELAVNLRAVSSSMPLHCLLSGPCGACLRSFGGAGSAPGLFDTPTGMVHDGHGRLLVSEAGAKRIQMLTTHGVPLQVLALPHAGRLYGMCVRGGVIYVADYENHQVHVLDLKQEQLPLRPPASPARPIVSTQSTVDALYLTS